MKDKLNKVLFQLPGFVSEFINSQNLKDTSKTAYSFAIKLYFEYVSEIANKPIIGISINDIDNKRVLDTYINSIYENTNASNTVYHNIKAIRRLYDYLYRENFVNNKYDFPSTKKIRNSNLYSESDYRRMIEIADDISNNIEEYVSKRNAKRDALLFALIYDIGLKTSECMKLTNADIDLKNSCIYVDRKKRTKFQLNQRCRDLVREYYYSRDEKAFKPEAPFLISQQNRGLGIRSIEVDISNMTKKRYTKLTPTTLRLLCGARLFINSGDMGYVAKFLGVNYNTVEDHYMCIKNTKVSDDSECLSISV